MAEAVKELYPETQVTFGPATETGFYYDFARDEPFTPEDLERIEARMREIVRRDETITREVWDRDAAVAFFAASARATRPNISAKSRPSEEISLYRQGEFRRSLRRPASALDRSSRPGLQADERGRRLLARRSEERPAAARLRHGMGRTRRSSTNTSSGSKKPSAATIAGSAASSTCFICGEEAVGSVFWHPKGWTLFRIIENYMRMRLDAAGYQEVKGPQLLDRSLWEASGHWENFRENMFIAESRDERVLAVKPMNCPGHVLIFRNRLRSYRELPLRLAEFGSCHRNEPSGALHGIMRVRGFTQDDAHIFCTEDQVTPEVDRVLRVAAVGVPRFRLRRCRGQIRRPAAAARRQRRGLGPRRARLEGSGRSRPGCPIRYNPGEGAFYGPKLEFVLARRARPRLAMRHPAARFRACRSGSARAMSARMAARHRRSCCTARSSARSSASSAILIEHYAGRFPLWLAPVQVVVASITSEAAAYAEEVARRMRAPPGCGSSLDTGNEKINYKVREHSLAKVPVMLVVGRREAANAIGRAAPARRHGAGSPCARRSRC